MRARERWRWLNAKIGLALIGSILAFGPLVSLIAGTIRGEYRRRVMALGLDEASEPVPAIVRWAELAQDLTPQLTVVAFVSLLILALVAAGRELRRWFRRAPALAHRLELSSEPRPITGPDGRLAFALLAAAWFGASIWLLWLVSAPKPLVSASTSITVWTLGPVLALLGIFLGRRNGWRERAARATAARWLGLYAGDLDRRLGATEKIHEHAVVRMRASGGLWSLRVWLLVTDRRLIIAEPALLGVDLTFRRDVAMGAIGSLRIRPEPIRGESSGRNGTTARKPGAVELEVLGQAPCHLTFADHRRAADVGETITRVREAQKAGEGALSLSVASAAGQLSVAREEGALSPLASGSEADLDRRG